MSDWISCVFDMPPEGQVVEVQNNDGAKLVYENGLWWFPDRSMYVYYTPQYWRPLKEK